MSDTKRTDMESWAHPTDGTEVVNADFARQLERELSAEREKVRELREALDYLFENITPPPEANCSCHMSPPCSDCVNYGAEREAIVIARATLEKTK